MKPRDRGTIVQVGSALAYRGIPLQSAYCGAKHAIQGFHEALRCELLHEQEQRARHDGADAGGEHPAVLLGAVPAAPPRPAGPADLPARVRRPRRPVRRRPSEPARVLGRRQHDGHAGRERDRARACWTATSARPASSPSKPSNRTTRTPRSTCGSRPTAATGRDFGAHGVFDAKSHHRDPQLWASQHHGLLGVAALAGAAAASARADRPPAVMATRLGGAAPGCSPGRHAAVRLRCCLLNRRQCCAASPATGGVPPAGIVRVLGARLLAQATAEAVRPRPDVLRLGVAVDLAHAASCSPRRGSGRATGALRWPALAVAGASRRRRRPAGPAAAMTAEASPGGRSSRRRCCASTRCWPTASAAPCIGPRGDIVWLCAPRWDSDAVFSSLDRRGRRIHRHPGRHATCGAVTTKTGR